MKFASILICIFWPCLVVAQDRNFTLSAPAEVADTGFLRHLLPRFSLKHGVRITVVDADADVAIGTEGVPIFAGFDQIWHITQNDAEGPVLFTEWLTSDIGRRTIDSFEVDGAAPFTADVAVEVATPALSFDGDAVAGEGLSLLHCGRCHVVNDSNRMNDIGQTPSFALMRTFADWPNRFSTFYVLNPHPSFTQVVDITPPFPSNLPPAIVPVEITQDELEAIVAYVATIAPADLGAPLQNQ